MYRILKKYPYVSFHPLISSLFYMILFSWDWRWKRLSRMIISSPIVLGLTAYDTFLQFKQSQLSRMIVPHRQRNTISTLTKNRQCGKELAWNWRCSYFDICI